jgi:hypothetical protein
MKSKLVNDLLRGALVASALAIIPALSAASGPPSGAGGGAVNVQGVVEVLNDTLTQPFRQTRISLDVVVTHGTSPVTFDVPFGKRLIVESVTIFARVAQGQKALVRGIVSGSQGGAAAIDLTLTPQGTFGALDMFTATTPLSVRVDGTVSTDEISFVLERNANSGPAFLSVSVFGYLVDSPLIN